MVRRVVDVFDANGDGELDFKEFIDGLAQVANKADKLQKLSFAFKSVASNLISQQNDKGAVFLNAFTYLYKMACRSVRRSVSSQYFSSNQFSW